MSFSFSVGQPLRGLPGSTRKQEGQELTFSSKQQSSHELNVEFAQYFQLKKFGSCCLVQGGPCTLTQGPIIFYPEGGGGIGYISAKASLGFEISDVRTCVGFEKYVVACLQLKILERTFYGFDFFASKREFLGSHPGLLACFCVQLMV